MPRFIYKAKKGPATIIKGQIEAENESAALSKLNQMGYFTIFLEQASKQKKPLFALDSREKKISLNDLCIFTRQLSDLFDAGLTLIRALDIIYQQTENKNFKAIIQDIRNQVREGVSFSQALSNYPKVFSSLYVNIVKSGEISGSLDKVLSRLARLFERDREFISQVHSALVYPALMLTVGLATVFILMTFVIPRLVSMFKEMGQVLPLPTQILISISNFFTLYWLRIIALGLLIFFILRRYRFSKEGKIAVDRIKLNIPFFGEFLRKFELARFTRTLGTLLANGVSILESLIIVARVIENAVLKGEIAKVHKAIEQGSSLSKEIAKSKEFPFFLSNMITIGEEAGALDSSLLKIANTYEEQTQRTLRTITSLIEPLLILIMGSIVGFIVMAMLLPIFQISIIAK